MWVWPEKNFVLTNFWFVNQGGYVLSIFEKSALATLEKAFLQAAIFADVCKNLKSTYFSDKNRMKKINSSMESYDEG